MIQIRSSQCRRTSLLSLAQFRNICFNCSKHLKVLKEIDKKTELRKQKRLVSLKSALMTTISPSQCFSIFILYLRPTSFRLCNQYPCSSFIRYKYKILVSLSFQSHDYKFTAVKQLFVGQTQVQFQSSLVSERSIPSFSVTADLSTITIIRKSIKKDIRNSFFSKPTTFKKDNIC